MKALSYFWVAIAEFAIAVTAAGQIDSPSVGDSHPMADATPSDQAAVARSPVVARENKHANLVDPTADEKLGVPPTVANSPADPPQVSQSGAAKPPASVDTAGQDSDRDAARRELRDRQQGARQAHRDQRQDRANDRWRFRFHNGEWWYWMPGNFWVYYRGNHWNRYDAAKFQSPTSFANRFVNPVNPYSSSNGYFGGYGFRSDNNSGYSGQFGYRSYYGR
ncbi:MAG: hypothetical protein IT427_18400 [Pirellulales bacterium]|nr:hypothetical protein [Pirellulales bacterium]